MSFQSKWTQRMPYIEFHTQPSTPMSSIGTCNRINGRFHSIGQFVDLFIPFDVDLWQIDIHRNETLLARRMIPKMNGQRNWLRLIGFAKEIDPEWFRCFGWLFDVNQHIIDVITYLWKRKRQMYAVVMRHGIYLIESTQIIQLIGADIRCRRDDLFNHKCAWLRLMIGKHRLIN